MGSPVVVTVASSWTYNAATGRYTYSYAVRNAANSPNVLDVFGLRPAARPISVAAPKGWKAFRGWEGDSTAVVWAVVDPGPAPPTWRGQLYVGPYNLAPGASLGGFRIESEQPPDSAATFVAQGFDTIPGGGHSFGPRPPRNRTLWEEGFVGAAVVPSLHGVTPAPTEAPTVVVAVDSLSHRNLKIRSQASRGVAQAWIEPWPRPGSPDDFHERARAIAGVFAGDSLGRGLSSWIESHRSPIEEFHGSSYSIPLTEYWAFRNTSVFQRGRLAAFGYLLGSCPATSSLPH
jgi:hypothetical protein